MIWGIGIDNAAVDRFADKLQNAAFCARVYGEEERALLAGRTGRRAAEGAAGCFAAKEAFLKAAGRGLGGFALPDLQALRAESGAPYLAFSGAAAAWMQENRLTAHLSITHDGGIATAIVLLEQWAEELDL